MFLKHVFVQKPSMCQVLRIPRWFRDRPLGAHSPTGREKHLKLNGFNKFHIQGMGGGDRDTEVWSILGGDRKVQSTLIEIVSSDPLQ